MNKNVISYSKLLSESLFDYQLEKSSDMKFLITFFSIDPLSQEA